MFYVIILFNYLLNTIIVYDMKKILLFNLSDAFDEVFMYQTLIDIQAGKTCTIPVYNYKTNSR